MADYNEQEEATEKGTNPIMTLVKAIEDIDQDKLDAMGAELKEQVERDIESRSDWLERVESHVELTMQVMEKKTWPWDNASNVKYPLISVAAIQFHARAFPSLLGSSDMVRSKVTGKDPMGNKAARGSRVSTYMNYQLLNPKSEWVDDMDRLLLLLPIIGASYKKVYKDPATGKMVSEMIHPRDFIINYDAKDFKNARKTHRLWKTPNEIKEYQNRGEYLEFDGDDIMQPTKVASEARDKTQGLNNSGTDEEYALQELYEVHCLWDLDEDGYKEPYIVTIREKDGKVFKIVPSFDLNKVEFDEEKIIAIEPRSYFSAYFFMPDPESKTHGVGFGTMVGPMNDAVNTIVNQLLDAGTLNNLQGGFIARGIRTNGGNLKFSPGEWKTINATGDDLRKGIFAMPTREPSTVLFQLLGMLIESGKDLTSVQDLMVGKNPGQNQPFSTSQMVMEQGLQVFNGIYKRIYRAMSREFVLIYNHNSKYLDVEHYAKVLDDDGMEVQKAAQEFGAASVIEYLTNDFNREDLDIMPTAEPDMIAEVQRIMKANSLLEKMRAGLQLNPVEVTKRILEAEQHENIEALMALPPPQPDPEIELKRQELKLDGLRLELDTLVGEAEALLKRTQARSTVTEAKRKQIETGTNRLKAESEIEQSGFEALTKRLKVLQDGNKDRGAGKQATREDGASN